MMRSAENEFEGNDHFGRGVLVRIGERAGVSVMEDEGEGEGVGEKELLMVVDEDIRRDHELNRLYTCDAQTNTFEFAQFPRSQVDSRV